MDFSVVNTLKSGLGKARKIVSAGEDGLEKIAEEARRMLEDSCDWATENIRMPPIKTELTRDPSDANDSGDVCASGLSEAEKKDEAKLFETLDASEKTAYQAVKKTIEGDKAARKALLALLADGRLDKGLLGNLAGLSGEKMAEGINKNVLLADLIQEIADPSVISQKKDNTCGATSAQILLARRDPSEYVRLVAGLASPEGKVSSKNGEILERKADWEAEDGGRTLSSRLLQPAFMEQSNGKLFSYDNARDGHNFLGFGNFPGMLPNGLAHVLQGLDGHPRQVLLPVLGKSDEIWEKIQQAGSKNEIPVALNYQDKAPIAPAHWMLVTGVKDGYVNLINPRGWEEKMTVQEFRKQLLAAVVEK